MRLVFKHDIDGVFGKEYVEESTYAVEGLVKKGLRAFKGDVWSTLWLTEMEAGKSICLSWDTFDDYEEDTVTVTVWNSYYESDEERMPWLKARKFFMDRAK